MLITCFHFINRHAAAATDVASPACSAAVLLDQWIGERRESPVFWGQIERETLAKRFILLTHEPLAGRKFAVGIKLQVGFASQAVVLYADLVVERSEKVVERVQPAQFHLAAFAECEIGDLDDSLCESS